MTGIRDRKGVILVTGEVGTGKTTLIRSLLGSLDGKVNTAFIFHTRITFEELLANILSELGLSDIGKDKGDLWNHLIRYANLVPAQDERLTIFIDEAQRLDKGVLEELLQKFFGSRSKSIQIILVGQPELDEKLNASPLARFKDKLQIRCQIAALSEDESERYIGHRLRLAGGQGIGMFTPRALSLICRYSRGIPRTINIVCDNALLTGYGLSKKTIDEKIIRKVTNELEGKKSRKPFLSSTSESLKSTLLGLRLTFSFKWVSLALLFLACCISLLLSYGNLQRESAKTGETSSMPSYPLAKTDEPSTPPLRTAGVRTPDKKEPLYAAPSVSSPQATDRKETKLEAMVTAKEGDTLSILALKYYGWVNPTLIDLIQVCNPEIVNVNIIGINQAIRFPRITEESLILTSPDLHYEIHAGTFKTRDSSKLYTNEPILAGMDIKVLSREVSPRETWYRVVIGKFTGKDEALRTARALREEGVLPSFRESPNTD